MLGSYSQTQKKDTHGKWFEVVVFSLVECLRFDLNPDFDFYPGEYNLINWILRQSNKYYLDSYSRFQGNKENLKACRDETHLW